MFNPINNATVMNSLPLRHRGVASGMMETTREMGHALGATTAAAMLALALPAGVSLSVGIHLARVLHTGLPAIQPDGGVRAVLWALLGVRPAGAGAGGAAAAAD